MSTTTVPAPRTGVARGLRSAVGPGRLLRRTLAAEWTRLVTVRSTWWCVAATVVMVGGLGLLLGLDAAGDPQFDAPPAHVAGELAVLPGLFALLVLAVLAVTSDHASGAISTTLQWTPRRRTLLVARVLLPVPTATVVGALSALLATTAAWLAMPSLELTVGGVGPSLALVAGVVTAASLMAVGIALVVRGTAGALALVVVLVLVLPVVLPNLPVAWLVDAADLLPGTAAMFLLAGEVGDLSADEAWAVLAAWAGVSVAAGTASFLSRDAG